MPNPPTPWPDLSPSGCAFPECRCPVDSPEGCAIDWHGSGTVQKTTLAWQPIITPPTHSAEVLVLLRYRTGKRRVVVGKYHPRALEGKRWTFRGARWQRQFVAAWAEVTMPEAYE